MERKVQEQEGTARWSGRGLRKGRREAKSGSRKPKESSSTLSPVCKKVVKVTFTTFSNASVSERQGATVTVMTAMDPGTWGTRPGPLPGADHVGHAEW